MRPPLLLAALLAVAACDAVAPDPPPPPPDPAAPTLTLVRPLADTVVFVGSPRWVPLEERFRHSAGAPLSYAAHSEGEALSVHVSAYDYLVLEPQALGAATVIVEARAEDGTRAADTLAVEVRPACPPEPAPGARDYFPLEAGRTWRFEGTRTTFYPNHTQTASIEASFTVDEAVCRAGKRKATLRVTGSGSTFPRDFELTETFDHMLFFGPAFLHPGEISRYDGPTAPDTLDAATFFDPVATHLCWWYYSNSPTTHRALLAADVGPAEVWRQRPVSHQDYGPGTQTCRLDLVP